MKQVICLIVGCFIFFGFGCSPVENNQTIVPESTTETEKELSDEIAIQSEVPALGTEYAFEIYGDDIRIGFNPPADHVVLGPYTLEWSTSRKLLEICPRDAAEQNEVNPEFTGSGLACEDALVWVFEGDLSIEQVVGSCPTCVTTEQIEKTHGQNIGVEFMISYSGQKVFIFKKFGYTFAVVDMNRYSNKGLPQADWDAMLDSIVVESK
jgi:hypothetical protein